MIELLIDFALSFSDYLLKMPGNCFLRMLGRDVDMEEDSFAAYGVGVVMWLMIALLVWLIVFQL